MGNRTLAAGLAMLKSGVETRLIIGSQQAHPDLTLIRNVQRAREWYRMIIAGVSYSEIAQHCGTHRDHIKKMIPLAFLAPDLLTQIAAGTQPSWFTSTWVKKNSIPAEWMAQRHVFKRS